MFRSYFTKDGFQPCGYQVNQHFPSVFGTPNNMILARIHTIAITSIYNRLFSRTHVLYYTAFRWIVNPFRRFAPPPYIPRAEARGFTAGLVIDAVHTDASVHDGEQQLTEAKTGLRQLSLFEVSQILDA